MVSLGVRRFKTRGKHTRDVIRGGRVQRPSPAKADIYETIVYPTERNTDKMYRY